jgi:hypothetical protein
MAGYSACVIAGMQESKIAGKRESVNAGYPSFLPA